jgi:hypothetical protein
LRGIEGSQKIAKGYLGLFASENEIKRLKCRIEYQASSLKASGNSEFLDHLSGEKDGKENSNDPEISTEDLAKIAYDLVLNKGVSSRKASFMMEEKYGYNISHDVISRRVKDAIENNLGFDSLNLLVLAAQSIEDDDCPPHDLIDKKGTC